ncbi:helix-turn-helix domain-containing protein [Streptacidiphilus fuscans]|uniref:Helix-turn-helix transcriptional regulator n=1 Tax=Streptacidiphilus fuscans TaxID=2789292 RepID=A0A931B5Y8_9ACTN|nr:helix-turn-helix transcriptional regulator [Streptacidiphilus fuscans]MBF9071830.1 helix-turn-helix transcriptional regulator [Streptacidiphilus fuscans]
MPYPRRPLQPTRSATDWLGAEIRHWREARGLSAADLGRNVGLSTDAVEKIEKGDRLCSAEHAGLMDKLLNTGGVLSRFQPFAKAEGDRRRRQADNQSSRVAPAAGGGILAMSRSVKEPPPVHRRTPVAPGTLGLVAGLASLGEEQGFGARISAADVRRVDETATHLREWGNLYGSSGAIFQTSALDVLQQSVERAGDCSARIRPQLLAAAGRLALTLGSNRFDGFHHEQAKTLFALATACSEEADDWTLRASVLNWRARQAIWLGRPDQGLTFAEMGLVRPDRIPPRAQAALQNCRARAYALLGQAKPALAAVDASDRLFESAWGQDEPAWLAYYDAPQHHGDTGHALRDLAIAGMLPPDRAADRLRTAVAGHADAYRRSRAMSISRLATLLLVTGDPQEAMTVAHQALDDVGQVRSRRAAADLSEFADLAAQRRAPGTAVIRERIAAAVGR